MAHKICCKTSSTPEWGWRAGNLENQDMPSMALVGCSCWDWLKNRAIVPKGCLRWLPWQPKEDGFQLSCDRKSWTVPVTFRSGPRPLGNIYGVVTVATGTCTQSRGLWHGRELDPCLVSDRMKQSQSLSSQKEWSRNGGTLETRDLQVRSVSEWVSLLIASFGIVFEVNDRTSPLCVLKGWDTDQIM